MMFRLVGFGLLFVLLLGVGSSSLADELDKKLAKKDAELLAEENHYALPNFLYGPKVMMGWYSPGRFELAGNYHRVSARQSTELGINLVLGGRAVDRWRGLVLDLTPYVGVHHGMLTTDHSMFATGSYLDAVYRMSFRSLHPFVGAGMKLGGLLGDQEITAYEIYAHVLGGFEWVMIQGLALNLALSLSYGYLGLNGHMDLTVDGQRRRTPVRHEMANSYGVGGMIGLSFY